MIISQSTIRGLRTDLERMMPFLIEAKISFLFNSENVEIIAECGTTLIEAIRDRICANITNTAMSMWRIAGADLSGRR